MTAILTAPGGWLFLLLVVFWIALGWIAFIRRAWPFYITRPVRIDPELAQQDREARTYAELNSIRSLSAPAAKGFKRPLPFNPNHELRAMASRSERL
jgi:hypothetical protein